MKKRTVITGIVCFLGALLMGCESIPLESSEYVEEKVILTVTLPGEEWSGYTKELTGLYLAEHPEIEDIHWQLVDRSTYSDLLRVNLASQNLPDLMGIGGQVSLREWKDHLIKLDDSLVQGEFLDSCLEMGQWEGELYSLPVMIWGRGILYNTRILEETGIRTIPETRDELAQMCMRLEEADIKPFINHYKEMLLSGSSWLFLLPADQGGEIELWKGLSDFLQLTLMYGNRNSLTEDKDTARDYFLIEKYAMLNDSGTWMAPVIRKRAPSMEYHVSLGGIPLGTRKAQLSAELLSVAVTKSSRHQEEALEFLEWLSCSEEARQYFEETMGCLTAVGMKTDETHRLSPLAAQLKQDILQGQVCWSRPVKEELEDKNAQLWSSYLMGKLEQEDTIERVFGLWENNKKE